MCADVLAFLEDLNPTLLATINAEFDKVADQSAPVPTRTSAEIRVAPAEKGKKGGSGDPLDELVPRQDLDKLVASTSFVKDSKSANFKERKAGADALLAVLEVKANSRLKSNMGTSASLHSKN